MKTRKASAYREKNYKGVWVDVFSNRDNFLTGVLLDHGELITKISQINYSVRLFFSYIQVAVNLPMLNFKHIYIMKKNTVRRTKKKMGQKRKGVAITYNKILK